MGKRLTRPWRGAFSLTHSRNMRLRSRSCTCKTGRNHACKGTLRTKESLAMTVFPFHFFPFLGFCFIICWLYFGLPPTLMPWRSDLEASPRNPSFCAHQTTTTSRNHGGRGGRITAVIPESSWPPSEDANLGLTTNFSTGRRQERGGTARLSPTQAETAQSPSRAPYDPRVAS